MVDNVTKKWFRSLEVLWEAESRRYLAIGGLNTLCGYFLGVMIFKWLSPSFTIAVIGVFGFVVTTSLSFFTQRRFVFRRRGPWLWQLGKSYFSYASVGLFGTGLLWFAVTQWHLEIWSAQALATFVPAVILYFSNKFFVFGRRTDRPEG